MATKSENKKSHRTISRYVQVQKNKKKNTIKKQRKNKEKKNNTPPYKRDTWEPFIQSQHSQNCIPNNASLDTNVLLICFLWLVSWELSAIDHVHPVWISQILSLIRNSFNNKDRCEHHRSNRIDRSDHGRWYTQMDEVVVFVLKWERLGTTFRPLGFSSSKAQWPKRYSQSL